MNNLTLIHTKHLRVNLFLNNFSSFWLILVSLPRTWRKCANKELNSEVYLKEIYQITFAVVLFHVIDVLFLFFVRWKPKIFAFSYFYDKKIEWEVKKFALCGMLCGNQHHNHKKLYLWHDIGIHKLNFDCCCFAQYVGGASDEQEIRS